MAMEHKEHQSWPRHDKARQYNKLLTLTNHVGPTAVSGRYKPCTGTPVGAVGINVLTVECQPTSTAWVCSHPVRCVTRVGSFCHRVEKTFFHGKNRLGKNSFCRQTRQKLVFACKNTKTYQLVSASTAQSFNDFLLIQMYALKCVVSSVHCIVATASSINTTDGVRSAWIVMDSNGSHCNDTYFIQ